MGGGLRGWWRVEALVFVILRTGRDEESLRVRVFVSLPCAGPLGCGACARYRFFQRWLWRLSGRGHIPLGPFGRGRPFPPTPPIPARLAGPASRGSSVAPEARFGPPPMTQRVMEDDSYFVFNLYDLGLPYGTGLAGVVTDEDPVQSQSSEMHPRSV